MDIVKILKEEQKEYKITLSEDIQDNSGASIQMTTQSNAASTLFPTAYARGEKKVPFKRIPTRTMEEFMLFLQQMQQQMQEMEQQQQMQQPQQQQEAFTISSLKKGLGSLVLGGSLAMSPQAQSATEKPTPAPAASTQQEEKPVDVVNDLLVPHLKQVEGFRSRRYNDHKNNPTVGHGALIDSTLNGTLEKVFPYQSKDWRQKILTGNAELSRAQAHDLITHQARQKHDHIRDLIGHEMFDSMHPELRMHLASEHFRGSIAGSPKTMKLIKMGDLKGASAEFLDSDEYRANTDNSVGERMKKLSELLAKNHGKVKIVQKVDHSTTTKKKNKK